ncbi:hypothetical protein CkaCkLH20_05196 [Colletotrichum karsti]|uniref:Uncharacterized protein n=1 Tax=Colletotrichum karsti TaxID=1095194 RepID=A0A9P6I984_9PEZI|nr:uncharacterized protein CkaCkLH20_05196 [Colletotrichum karsti]KAF9877496.1 hypothetical protein CkaCkLH20_05196 [Colletotrichum karsti]
MSVDYTSKTVAITGGAAGLGLAITKFFLAANATVLALDISQTALDNLPSEVPEADRSRVHPVKCDVTSPDSVEAAFSSYLSGGEGRRLDVLVNNAGLSDKMHPTADCDMAMWEKNILVNMTGPFITSQQAIRQFLKQDIVGGQRGVILNVISAAGTHGARAGVAYTASKHGTVGLTRSTAAFYGPKGIRCLAIMPGPMVTGMARDKDHIADFHKEGLALTIETFKISKLIGSKSKLALRMDCDSAYVILDFATAFQLILVLSPAKMDDGLEQFNWKETFLFFYWDIQRYRPESAPKIDKLILDFFYEEEPAAGSNGDPYSWDAALYRLMRIIRCRLGSNICPGVKSHYRWLEQYDPSTNQSPPYVDWFWLEPHVSMEARRDATSHVLAIIEHLTTVVYRQQHDPDEDVDFVKAWAGNMLLKDFSDSHASPEWGVPIPVHISCLLAVGWDRAASIDKCEGRILSMRSRSSEFWYLPHPPCPCQRWPNGHLVSMPASADSRYEFILEDPSHMGYGTAKIRFPSEGLGHCVDKQSRHYLRLSSGSQNGLLRVEAAKLHFIGMLYWAQQMALTGHALPLPEFIDKQYEELAAVNDDDADRDEMKLDRMLWNALRSFGLERVKLNCKSCVETISSPPAM